jgi:hypothetical protein
VSPPPPSYVIISKYLNKYQYTTIILPYAPPPTPNNNVEIVAPDIHSTDPEKNYLGFG